MLGSSICQGARVRLDPALIAMSRGSEPIEQVMGRSEEEELPKYEPGALQVEGVAAGRTGPLVEAGFLDVYVPTGGIGMHAMRALLDSTRVVPPGELHCTQTMNKVFEHAGDLVNIRVAHNLMRLIAEGFGEEDESADSQLRSSAVDSYLQIVEEPKLPSSFMQGDKKVARRLRSSPSPGL